VPDTHATALGASRALLRILRFLNLLVAALLLAWLMASFAFEPTFREFFAKQPPRIHGGLLMPLLRIWIVLGMPALAALHIVLSRLLAMIEAVRAGDPFVPENAARLKTIAWCMASSCSISPAG
jgi:hypothetical protein